MSEQRVGREGLKCVYAAGSFASCQVAKPFDLFPQVYHRYIREIPLRTR